MLYTDSGWPVSEDQAEYCAIEAAMEVLGGKWKLAILNKLVGGSQRFGQLKRAMPAITQRMLTRQLRELEDDGLVRRTVYAQVPPRVDYALTGVGASLLPLMEQLDTWGRWYQSQSQPGLDRTAPDPRP